MCHNGNLRWKTWHEYRHMLVCQSTLASTRGVVRVGHGGKQRQFLGRIFRTCMYKYPWKATFREPANQLNQPANQSHTVPDIPQPSSPPPKNISLIFNSISLWFHFNLLSAHFYKQTGSITTSSCWLSNYLCSLKCMFFFFSKEKKKKKKHPAH